MSAWLRPLPIEPTPERPARVHRGGVPQKPVQIGERVFASATEAAAELRVATSYIRVLVHRGKAKRP